ncbi:pirin family protein [Clostridium arbusti]|uniref:pirin family protein n=1 Tax=Clostridium arbusti TaxID=1137848 RepID=UPI0002898D5C|nr:pirin family protein [Clostridium arbusti]
MNMRTIDKIVDGNVGYDGAGVKLVRVIANKTVKKFDPFLMLDVFDSVDPEDYIKGFPWHPHRGIETITYLIQGKIEHGDSLGNRGSIDDGCCQWMTAGGGIIHQEMPKPSERMFGFQLWLNLPKKNKMCNPKYHDIRAETIPKIDEDGCTINVISGNYKGNPGAIQGEYVKTQIFDVNMEKNSDWSIETNSESTVFIYIFQGEGCFDEENKQYVHEKNAVLLTSGEKLKVHSSDKGMRFSVFMGNPLKEPVAWGGPIVMNTKEELKNAFDEIEKGTFVKNGNNNYKAHSNK